MSQEASEMVGLPLKPFPEPAVLYQYTPLDRVGMLRGVAPSAMARVSMAPMDMHVEAVEKRAPTKTRGPAQAARLGVLKV